MASTSKRTRAPARSKHPPKVANDIILTLAGDADVVADIRKALFKLAAAPRVPLTGPNTETQVRAGIRRLRLFLDFVEAAYGGTADEDERSKIAGAIRELNKIVLGIASENSVHHAASLRFAAVRIVVQAAARAAWCRHVLNADQRVAQEEIEAECERVADRAIERVTALMPEHGMSLAAARTLVIDAVCAMYRQKIPHVIFVLDNVLGAGRANKPDQQKSANDNYRRQLKHAERRGWLFLGV